MRLKRCKRCGTDFETGREGAYFCPSCSALAKQTGVIRPRTCRQCGAVFGGGPRAMYCPMCRAERVKAANRAHKQHGPARPLGSVDICQRCGHEYVVEGGQQRYCKACANIAVAENVRLQKRVYNAKNCESITAHKTAMRTYNKVCVVCGKTFSSGTPAVTCSPTCARERKNQLMQAADYRRGKRKSPPGVPYNSGLPKSGIVGVTARRNGKWSAVYKGKYLGVFDTIEQAESAINAYKGTRC